jgi:hypothetical protein
MLGAGCDGHVIQALGASLATYLCAAKDLLQPRAVCLQASLGIDRTDDVPVELKHCRMGHPGITAAKRLGWEQIHGFFCEPCMAGKVIHSPSNQTPVPKMKRPGALVCGDIIGRFTPSKQSGCRWAAVFVSAYGNYVHTYPLKSPSDFVNAFKHVCIEYETAGHRIERF